MRWIGVFTAGVLVTVIIGVFNVAHSAGKMEAKVEQLQESVSKQERQLEEQSKKQERQLDEQNKLLRDMSAQLAELRAKGRP